MLLWDQPVAVPSFEQLLPAAPEVAFIGPLNDRRQAREWALVLQSQHISFVMQATVEGVVLRVSASDAERAWGAIELYEEENRDWPPTPPKDVPRHAPSPVMLLAFALVTLFFFNVTGPVADGSSWFSHGRADARLLTSEPWRMVTALTLHADAQHVLGNAISGTIFASMVSRRVGPGGALVSIAVAGAMGNAANAAYNLFELGQGHRSIGASTAVFAAVGILAAVQTMVDVGRHRNKPRGWRFVDMVAPLIGGLALLGALGAGKHSDLGAHGFGFASGLLVGAVMAIGVRRSGAPSAAVQLASGAAALALVVGSWVLAFTV